MQGFAPAINPGISVSRVGGAAQLKPMKKVSGELKLLYSQYQRAAGICTVRKRSGCRHKGKACIGRTHC